MQIREFIKKYKILLIILCLTALALGGFMLRRMLIFNKGSELLGMGEFAAAKAEFEKIGDVEKMAQCDHAYTLSRLENAGELMEAGELEQAKAELALLGDFENAPELLLECEYRMAVKMRDVGDYGGALKLAKRLDAHQDSAALVEEIQGLIYTRGLEAAYACRMEDAIADFELIPGYMDADALMRRCFERIAHLETGWSTPVNYSEYAGQKLTDGTLYWHDEGLIYVPYECSAETTAMIFYPGGYDQSLANGYISDYLYGYYGELPNAIMLFCASNGYGSFEEKIPAAHAALEQAAMENDVFLHDVVLVGASNGAYTAAHTAVWLYEEQGISAKYVLTLDAGQHWESFMPVLSPEDCDVMAKSGTAFYLVEGDGVGMNKLAIQTMVAHGMDVTIAHVKNYGHYSVIYDAMEQGLFGFVMGANSLPQNDNYSYIHLNRDSKYPN